MASSISIGDDPRVYHTYFSMVRGLSLVRLEQLYVYCELAWVVGRSKYLLKRATNFDLICGKKTTPEVGVDNDDEATIGLGGGGMETRLAISVLTCSCTLMHVSSA